MSDLSKLSNEELMSLYNQSSEPSPQDLSKLSNEELMALDKQTQEEGFLSKAGSFLMEDVLAPVGNALDTYGGGASTRSALGELSSNKSFADNVIDAGAAAYGQYGEDPSLAPTGKQLMQKAGVSDTSLSEVLPELYTNPKDNLIPGLALERGGIADPTASGVAGFGAEMILDPLNLIPGVGIAKGARASGRVAKEAVKVVAKEAIPATLKGVGNVGRKTFEGAKDVALGTANAIGRAADVMQGVNKGDGYLSKAINAQVDAKKGKLSKIADKNMGIATRLGMDPADLPSSLMFDGAIPRFERSIAMGPSGQEFLTKIDGFYDNLDSKALSSVEKLSGVKHSNLSQEALGDFVVDAVENSTQNLFKNNEIRYSTIIGNAKKPINLSLTAAGKLINGLESLKVAADRMTKIADPTLKAQADRLLHNINSIQDYANMGDKLQVGMLNRPDLDFFVENMKAVREMAYPPKGQNIIQVTPDMQKSYQELYRVLNKSIVNSVFSYDPKMGRELVKSNEAISKFSNAIKPIDKLIGGGRVRGSSLFNTIKGDAQKIEALKNIMTPNEFQKLKGGLVKDAINMDASNQILYPASKKALDRSRPMLSKFLSKQDLQELDDILHLGVQAEGRIGALPQTGAVTLFGKEAADTLKDVHKRVTLEQLRSSAAQGNVRLSKLYGHKEIAQEAVSAAKKMKNGLYSIELPKTTLDEFLKDFVKEKTSKEFMGVKALEQFKDTEE